LLYSEETVSGETERNEFSRLKLPQNRIGPEFDEKLL
jgi:hypothetical protein